MPLLLGAVSLLALVLATGVLVRWRQPASPVGVVLLGFNLLVGLVLLLGHGLSALGRFGSAGAWAAGAGLVLTAVLLLARIWPGRRPATHSPISPAIRWPATRVISLLAPLLLIVLLLVLANLALVLFTAPHNSDSLAYHLPRVGYYLQQGSLDRYRANYWAQIVHLKNPAVLLGFLFVAGGGRENLLQLAQYVAYGVAAVSVYGSARRLDAPRPASLLAALVFALLIQNLMAATTTQNDLLVAAHLGTAVYFLLTYRRHGGAINLAWAGLGLGLTLGVKASALALLPALTVVAAAALWRRSRRPAGLFLGSLLLAVALFALPSGYVENWRISGHPVGPAFVREHHSLLGRPPGAIMADGTRNLFRLGLDFLSLDGLPRVGPVLAAQRLLRAGPVAVVRATGLDLEGPDGVRAAYGFRYDRRPFAHEDRSTWGVLGFALVWPVVGLALLGAWRRPGARALALAALLGLLAHAYLAPYDWFLGRYFGAVAVLATPLVALAAGHLRPRRHATAVFWLLVLGLGGLSGMTAVLFRNESPLVTLRVGEAATQSVFSLDRTEQLLRGSPAYLAPVRRYEALTPPDAVVAVYLPPDSPEYPLFGPRFGRRLLPVVHAPIPPEAAFLVYDAAIYPEPRPGDRPLGNGWYWRDLR